MKRTIMVIPVVALTVLAAGSGLAREVGQAERPMIDAFAPVPAPASPATPRADTLFLFAASGPGAWGMPGTNARGYTFDDGAGGPAPAGWTTWDATSQEGAYWHLQSLTLSNGHATDFSAVDDFADGGPTAGNDYAWWCGREDACGWVHGTGYGTNWEQWLVLTVAPEATDGVIEFDYIGDFEGGSYDHFTLYRRTGAAEPVELAWNYASGERTVIHYGPIAFGDVDELIFAFQSDGGWSDEDGSFLTDIGALWIDNLVVDYTGAPDLAWDFESGIEADFPALTATYPAGAGAFGALYRNLFQEDPCIINSTYAWAFFDLHTTNPDYPLPVTPFGPPYFDNGIRSPLFEKAHALGDPGGLSVGEALDAQSKFLVRWMVYRDLPLDGMVFYMLRVSAQVEGTPCLGVWADNNTVYYGDDDAWGDWFLDYTLRLQDSAGGGDIRGISISLSTVDMCSVWCDIIYDGYLHTPAPYFDTISAMLVEDSGIAWNVDVYRRFQDNFPETNGKVRIDSAIDVQPLASTTLVIGDSTKIDLNMDGEGGIQPDLVSVPGEVRPSLYLHARVVAGPHVHSIDPAMGDPDASDGIWSPHIGTALVHGETWNVVIADSARYRGTVSPGSWALDFAEDYFEPGDIIEFYYKATSNEGISSTRPPWAESGDPDLRSTYTVRCLPTAGATLLFVDDGSWPDAGSGSLATPWWEGFTVNGYVDYDVYTTQVPSSGLHNGLGGRAEIGDLDQYEMIVWDSGDLPTYTIQNALPDDLAFDDLLLADWLTNTTHNTALWVMGNEVASDLADEPSFLNATLGATRILSGTYYDDLTGIKVPLVYATHPALAIDGQTPYFVVAAGCPTIDNLDLVQPNPTNPLAVEAFAWENAGGTQARAGIYNMDPDGDGLPASPTGYLNRTLFNPFSYRDVWNAGFGIGDGYHYPWRLVGDVLANLCGFDPNGMWPCDAEPLPARTALAGAFPNPFNPKTTLRFALAAPEQVHLVVYDLAGRRVKTLIDAPLPAAHHEAIWDGRDDAGARVASGVYFVRLVAGDFEASEKLVLLK